MVYSFTRISDGYHVKNAALFAFTSFPRLFFTGIIGVGLPINMYRLSGGYQVKFELYFFPRVIHVAFLMWIIGVSYIFRCIPRELFHVDYWCTGSGGYQIDIM